jgi:hypothetical protein
MNKKPEKGILIDSMKVTRISESENGEHQTVIEVVIGMDIV